MPNSTENDPAVEMIRQKVRDLYKEEPNAVVEAVEAEAFTHPTSPHQRFMRGLNESGKSLVEVQAAWHSYYTDLPDHEKYQVWQEFYAENENAAPASAPMQQSVAEQAVQSTVEQPHVITPEPSHHTPQPLPSHTQLKSRRQKRVVTAAEIKRKIIHTVKTVSTPARNADGTKVKLKAKHHFQSLFFGLATGSIVVVIFLFSFFNEFVIAPLIQPSRKINDTPVIVDVASTVIGGGPKILIPKINVEIPVDYSQTTTSEKEIELALDKGIVHYPTTVRPGETGNAAYFGHSSNNIFNPGKYKFAFVLLERLVEGDVFYLTNDGKTYAYKVFSKRIVKPTEVGVLGPVEGHASTATLITCDPPGTSINRLVVVGDQISPDPNGNPAPVTAPIVQTAVIDNSLPGNGPTLWSRIWGSIF